jgi:Ni,Fe-hydrogenase maturation factor
LVHNGDWPGGIGNAERGDDGLGLEVARLVDHFHLADVHVTQLSEPVQLLDESLAADIVVVVDARSLQKARSRALGSKAVPRLSVG